jgi:hypothetical protein
VVCVCVKENINYPSLRLGLYLLPLREELLDQHFNIRSAENGRRVCESTAYIVRVGCKRGRGVAVQKRLFWRSSSCLLSPGVCRIIRDRSRSIVCLVGNTLLIDVQMLTSEKSKNDVVVDEVADEAN